MEKRLFTLISVLMVLTMVFTACGTKKTKPISSVDSSSSSKPETSESSKSELKQTDRVVLYTASSTNQNEMIQKMWATLHPDIELELVSAGSGELQNRIIAEVGNPQGDVMMGGSYAVYTALEDHLAPYVSDNVQYIIPQFKPASDKFTPIQVNVNTIMVNNKLLAQTGATVDGWESLTNPALKGNITFADPSSSSSGREQVVNMLAAMNTTSNLDDGWDFIEKFIKNLDGKISSSSSAIYTGVANGEYAVGITNEEKVIENIVNGADVSAVYAKEGITLRNSYCAIIKDCKNEYNARLLVYFFTSKEYQQACATELYQRSVRSDVDFTVEGILATTDLNAIEYPGEWVEKNSDALKEKFQDFWTSVK